MSDKGSGDKQSWIVPVTVAIVGAISAISVAWINKLPQPTPSPSTSPILAPSPKPSSVTSSLQPSSSSSSSVDAGSSFLLLNWRSTDFEGRRVIAETAWQTEAEAQRRGEVLHYENGFSNLGVLWIPYYKNLSGKKLYQIIIVPDRNCDQFLRQYRQKLKPTAYCFTPSNQGLPANRRGA